jgi:hypothetical protein
MSTQSAGTLLQQAIKAVCAAVIKMVALVVAWLFEIGGKVLFKLSDMIKNNAK